MSLPLIYQLAFLIDFGLQDMAWCQAYAFQNRKHMLDLMVDSVNEVTGALPDLKHSVNIHHNYCECERCEYTVCSSLTTLHLVKSKSHAWLTAHVSLHTVTGCMHCCCRATPVEFFVVRL